MTDMSELAVLCSDAAARLEQVTDQVEAALLRAGGDGERTLRAGDGERALGCTGTQQLRDQVAELVVLHDQLAAQARVASTTTRPGRPAATPDPRTTRRLSLPGRGLRWRTRSEPPGPTATLR